MSLIQQSKWDQAADELKGALRINSFYAPAYVASYCVEKKCPDLSKSMDGNMAWDANIKLALKNADPDYKAIIESYIHSAKERVEIQKRKAEEAAREAKRKAEEAARAAKYKELVTRLKSNPDKYYKVYSDLANGFNSLGDYEHSKEYADQCTAEAKNIKYTELVSTYNSTVEKNNILYTFTTVEARKKGRDTLINRYREMSSGFSAISDIKDSKNFIDTCENQIEVLKNWNYGG
jgi:tetratricopeptide (TPR) repeat protein